MSVIKMLLAAFVGLSQPQAPPPSSAVPPTPSGAPVLVIWRASPEWRLSFLHARSTEYVCPGHRIEVQERLRPEDPHFFIEVVDVRIDGHSISPERIAVLNARIAAVPAPVDLYPVCANNRVGVQLVPIDRHYSTRPDTFELN